MLIPVMTVAENIVLAAEPTKAGVVLDTSGRRAPRPRARRPVQVPHRPARPHPGHHGRPAAARRDPEGALPPRRHPHPRRADRRADAAGGARALRHPQEPRRRGHVGDLHLAQAERGARDRRPRHRAAPRQEGRHDPARGRDRGEPGADDGRPRGAAARRQAEGHAGRDAARGRGPARRRRPRPRGRARRLVPGSRRRDPRDRGRRRQRADGADRRDHRACAARAKGASSSAGAT